MESLRSSRPTLAQSFSRGLEPRSKVLRISIFFAVAVLGTIFDAFSSWQIIAVNPIAAEGNPILSSLAHLLGFGGAMAFRGFWGVVLLLALLPVSLGHIEPRTRRLASFGLYFTASVLFLLSLYHLWFRINFG